MKIKSVKEMSNEFSEFPFSKVYKFATIYSKSEIQGVYSFDEEEKKEMEDDDYEESTLFTGTRIGVCDGDSWDPELSSIIVVTDTMKWFSQDGMTTDGMLYLAVDEDEYHSTGEPVSIIGNYENGGGTTFGTKDILKAQVEKYKLDFLINGN